MELTDRVRNILKSRQICDECLGRQFHALVPRMPNREKGRCLRMMVQMEDAAAEKNPAYVEFEKCSLCGNIFFEIDGYVEKILEAAKGYEYSTFLIGSAFPDEFIQREEEFWEEFGVEHCEAIKSAFNRAVGIKVREKTGKNMDFENPDIMFIVDVAKKEVILQIAPLFIKGGYKKLLPKSTVQKFIEGELLGACGAKEAIFYSVGRLEENITTTTYRPFILMLRSAKKRRPGLEKIRQEINKRKSIQVSKMSVASKEDLDLMKSEKIAANYLITLKFSRLSENDKKEIKQAIKTLRNRRVLQVLKQKARRPYMRKLNPNFEGNTLILELESTVGFSVNSFLAGKSKPSLEKLIDRKFEIVSIVLRKFRRVKAKDMY
ncbi:MAG: THUMP domain-containing protein [Candidatus Aenigmatarchaeota archaeon]